MSRHAYLIVCYNQWELLKKLLCLLDDKRNDIFLHVDHKVKGVPFEELTSIPKFSRIIIVDRITIHRGTYSIFEAQMILLKAALSRGNYTYLHLLSGQDLPLKSQNYIHSFFEKNEGKNFVDVYLPEEIKRDWYERYSLYQFFASSTLNRNLNPTVVKCIKGIRKATIILQKLIGINRFKKYEKQGYQLCYGSNWSSITEEFAKYLIENEAKIQQMYKKHTFIPEESILQTFLWSSSFRETLYNADWLDHRLNRANLRMIFWKGKTSPETITMKNAEQLKHTNNLFARKFDMVNHPDVVEAVEAMILSGKDSIEQKYNS